MIVKVTIDGQEIFLEQQYDGTWQKINNAPLYAGVYPITVTVEGENGTITIIGSDDPELGKLLELIVLGKSISTQRMIKYLPLYLRKSKVVEAIFEAEGHEIDRLKDKKQSIIDNTYIASATESRIKEWEQKLKIIPIGTLDQRKTFILAILSGQGKLNEERIKMVVKAFTGGDAIITFNGSLLEIKILPPSNGDVFLFPDVKRALSLRVPAHIGLSVRRWYSSWKDIKENFSDWSSVAAMEDWNTVKNYIPPQ